MRKLRNYFVMMTVAIMALFCASCSSGEDEEQLEEFIEYSKPDSFYGIYASYTGEKALIDYRSASEYASGHLVDAVNMPATVYNVENEDSDWCKLLLAKYPDKDTRLYFYGNGSFEMNKLVAGRASKLGFGKENSFVYTGKYDDLKKYFGVE